MNVSFCNVLKTPDDPKNPTYEELLELWDELTILPDHFSLRMINYKDGTHVLVRASSKGLSDEIDLVLSRPMTTNEMYQHLMNLWLQAFNERERAKAKERRRFSLSNKKYNITNRPEKTFIEGVEMERESDCKTI